MLSFLIYAVLCAAGLFFSTLFLASLGDDWLIFGLVFGGSALAGLRMLWEKLDGIERKLDELREQQNNEKNE